MNSDMVKPEKYGRLHFVYHFTIPLSRIKPILDVVLKQGVLRIFKHGLARLYFRHHFKVKENINNKLGNYCRTD